MTASSALPDFPETLAVVGLTHLGCVLAAAWSAIGHVVRAVDFDAQVVKGLCEGEPPIFEPGLAEALVDASSAGRLSFSVDPAAIADAPYVFLSYDTPVGPDDSSDLAIVEAAVDALLPHFRDGAILIVSSQFPVGTARRFRQSLQERDASLDLVYSPENLRLGAAIRCYRDPGHVIIGCDDPDTGRSVAKLFNPMNARIIMMNLPSAEMAKHCINSFLATSVTLANQWADICSHTGADYVHVAAAIKLDHRIGAGAYISPGLGFSGGTLGRDLQVLEAVHRTSTVDAPLFGNIWQYNANRPAIVRSILRQIVGDLAQSTICLLGMTYKAGTSTLRRSVAVQVAEALATEGTSLKAYDPQAAWSTAQLPASLSICRSAYDAARDCDAIVLLTEWPEFVALDYGAMRRDMPGTALLDTKGILLDRSDELKAQGWDLVHFGRPHAALGTPK